MGFVNFIKSKYLWINLLLAIILVVALFLLLQWWLKSYTHHGETIPVPNLRGLTEDQFAGILEEKDLRYVISDSIYHPKVGKKAVVEQDPEPDMLVKENRTIYLTINASNPPMVKMPNLHDLSLRQATATLETYGLVTGRLIYVPDIAYNAVLEQQVNGKKVEPGTELMKGTYVDLVVGEGLSQEFVPVPNLTGMPYQEALIALSAAALNIGALITDPNNPITDTLQARIYQQSPPYSESATIKAGSTIDVWISNSPPADIPLTE